MSETYPQKKPLRNTFRRTYFPPAQDSGAKIQHFFETSKHIHKKIVIYVPKHK